MVDNNTPMRLLIIEDIDAERKRFLDYAKTCSDKIKFVGSTNSSRRGLEVVQEHNPDGIIVDLELKYGFGSGIEFLENLKKGLPDGSLYTSKKPIIVVTTQNPSEVVHNAVRKHGVDYIFFKGQGGYNPAAVINVMLLFHAPSDFTNLHSDTEDMIDIIEKDDVIEDDDTVESKKIDLTKVIGLINKELDAIGMGRHYKGRMYLVTAIRILAEELFNSSEVASKKTLEGHELAFKKAAEEHETAYNNVMRACTTAIENTWYDCDPDTLKKQYTMHISIKKERPTNNEFIFYYADKIINLLEDDN